MKRTLLAILLFAAALPSQAATVTSYGAGCGGMTLTVSPPALGTNVRAWAQSPRNNDRFVGFGLGKAHIALGGGCVLLVNASWVKIATLDGPVTLFLLPNDPTLIGLRFYVQAADNTGMEWSRGLEATIGR